MALFIIIFDVFMYASLLFQKYGLWRDAADITADMEAAEIKEHSVPASPEMVKKKNYELSSQDFKVLEEVYVICLGTLCNQLCGSYAISQKSCVVYMRNLYNLFRKLS